MTPSDTSEKASRVYYDRLAAMTPAERISLAAELWSAADSLQRAVLRRDYPEADEQEILFRLAVTRYGEELARKAYRRS